MVPSLLSTLIPMGYQIKVCGNVESELKLLQSSFPITTESVDVTDLSYLTSSIQGAVVVITMVPPRFHHYVLKACIACKINLVTPSYASQDMLSLEQAAEAAGIVVLNENGLDPGIDHMSVVAKLDSIRKLGGKVLEFQSSCGAFPAPEACTNKLCYKLAWAPYGALLAAIRPARYLRDGLIVQVPGLELMTQALDYDLDFPLKVMHYPNGDSTVYPEMYGIQEAKTVMRSTLRYSNTPIICKALCALGIYNESNENFPADLKWVELTERLSGELTDESLQMPSFPDAVHQKVSKKVNDSCNIQLILEAFNELGLFSDKIVSGRSIFDAYVNLVQDGLAYRPGERDCVVMEHRFVVQLEGKVVLYKSRLVDYGVPNGGTSAVSRLVSVPTALAADWICNHSHKPGFMYPMEEQFARDVLSRLEQEFNVKFVEEEEVIASND